MSSLTKPSAQQLPSLEETQNQATIEKMVKAFSEQDIEMIMSLFTIDATYYDVTGLGVMGGTFKGEKAIRKIFERQFALLPKHFYDDPIIFVSGNKACANWNLVLGSPDRPGKQYRTRGCDYFELEDGKVTLKNAWIKNGMLLTLNAVVHRIRSKF
ncbi:MAG: nuclear transport factor 2 family protein [Gammaproteobacteria bacterium]|nr:nuclear transport factor 2 family protein [Gammaproteobacteria bacterium]